VKSTVFVARWNKKANVQRIPKNNREPPDNWRTTAYGRDSPEEESRYGFIFHRSGFPAEI
jgi:hypothetical protein